MCFCRNFKFAKLIFQHAEQPSASSGIRGELEIKSSSAGIEDFLETAERTFKEKGEDGLKSLIADNPQYWELIEANLKEIEQKQAERIKKLLKEVRALQKRAVELLPDYPVSKKVAVIINGDSFEKRHTDNTERTIRVLRGLGFTEFFVSQSANVRDKKGVKQYPTSKRGIDKLFADLKSVLKKDALVFVHGTGHGVPNEGGALALNVPIGVDEIRSYMRIIKDAGSRIVGVFDNCYSGVFPRAIIEEEGLEGICLSPGIENSKTACQAFTPYFFEGLEQGVDINKDKRTEVQEAFLTAMQIYRHRTGEEAYGEYMESHTELTLKNMDRILRSGKTVLIDITATWCPPCKVLNRTFGNISGVLGDQVEIVTITDDINPDAEKLYERLGAGPRGTPTVLIHQAGRTEEFFVGAIPPKEILDLLKERGVKMDERHFRTVFERIRIDALGLSKEMRDIILRQYGESKSRKIFELFMFMQEKASNKLFLVDNFLHAMYKEKDRNIKRESSEAFFNLYDSIAGDYPLVVLNGFSVYKDQLWADRIFEKAIRSAAEKFPNIAMDYFEIYKDKPYAQEVYERAKRNAGDGD
ncbi:thioredoxin family protein [Candidatus Peregrinibacteria bacterium]|nr:thioredoxin family protein [Candidatus Peregrinibacteria bacterium]